MSVTPDPVRLFSEKARIYERFIRGVGYPRGLRSYFAHSRLLRPGLWVLDAGCGTGVVTFAIRDAMLRQGFAPGPMHAFDLTPAMLERFREELADRDVDGIELAECDVLRLEELPKSWSNYDLVVSTSMMEYLPRSKLSAALRGLRARLTPDGALVLFITRSNFLTRPLIERWWQANLYTAGELREAFREADFSTIAVRRFPFPYNYLDAWGHIVEASTCEGSL